MYYLLISVSLDEYKELRRPQAVEPEFCRMLVLEREIPRSVSPLTFHINPSYLRLDYIRIDNVSGGWLCSRRFIDILTSESIPFIAYPTQLLDEITGKPIAEHYSFWIPEEIEDSIDWEGSEVWVDPETGKRHLTKLILTTACEAATPLLFNPKGTAYYLIHDKVRMRLQTVGITGIAFVPLDAASVPLLGVQKLELERLLQEHPDDAENWFKLSGVLWQLHRQQEALEAINQALALKPDLVRGWWTRGRVLRELGRSQEALEAFKQAAQIDPQNGICQEYSAVLRELGYKEEALSIAEHLVQIWSKSLVSWDELGAAHAALGHYKESLQAFERALMLGGGPRIEEAYLGKGEMLYQLGRYEEALSTYTRGLQLKPWNRMMWEGKAKVLRALGREEEAKVAEQEVHKLEQEREKNLRARPL